MPRPKDVPFYEREGKIVVCSGTEKAIESSQKDITIQLFYSINAGQSCFDDKSDRLVQSASFF